MRTLVVGAGAVGGYFGARLAERASPVVFLARGETLSALCERGIRVESEAHPSIRIFPVRAVDRAESEGPFDLVLVCVKSPDTAAAVRDLGNCLAPDAIVVSLQNGIENEEIIERVLGLPPIPRALAFIGAESIAFGAIRHRSGGTIVVGEPGDARSERLKRFVAFLESAGIDVRVPDDIAQAQWQKLAWNAAFNLVSALTGRTVGEALADPGGRRLVATVIDEVEAVARANGVRFEERYGERVLRYTERHLGMTRPSTLQDRERGRSLEHDALTGAVVRFAERSGMDAPVCRTLDTLAALASRRTPSPPPTSRT